MERNRRGLFLDLASTTDELVSGSGKRIWREGTGEKNDVEKR